MKVFTNLSPLEKLIIHGQTQHNVFLLGVEYCREKTNTNLDGGSIIQVKKLGYKN